MCKYCNMIPDIHDWCETEFDYSGDPIVEGAHDICKIIRRNGVYLIQLNGFLGYRETLSAEPINYCPFCGRKLND